MANWKGTPRDNVILNISNGAPIQVGDGSDHNRNYNFSMLPDNDLSIPLQQFLRWKFRNMFAELGTCLLTYLLTLIEPHSKHKLG